MRWLGRALVGLVGLVLVAAGALWVALPGLVSPTGVPPVVPPLDGAVLAGAVRAAAGGQGALELQPATLDGLLESWAGSAGLSAAWATLGQGSIDLHASLVAPASLPRLGGHQVGVEVEGDPTVAADGTLTVSVQHVRVGRIPIDTFVPVPTLLRWVAAHAGQPQPWWHVEGAAVVVDPKTAPPLHLGQFALRLTPSALSVTPSAVVLTGTAEALVRLDADTLTSALAGVLQVQGVPAAATVRLQQGRAILSLFGPNGAEVDCALAPTVPQPGVLRVAVTGPRGWAASLAPLLAGASGGAPSWLSSDDGGLTVDFRRMPPIDVGQGGKLRLLPESVQVGPAMLQGWVNVLPGSGQAG